ncbi:MAG: hypothetical protein RIQ60_1942 [Pseudomonadota bacterium]|jgi:ribosomally synthesized peptide (two-chain TOMM family)
MSWFVKAQHPEKPGSDYKPGALESTAHWQIIWARAVAKAWSDDGFKSRLLEDARSAIKTEFGYDLSSQLHLTVVEQKSGQDWSYGTVNPEGDPWANLPQLKLELALPPAPEAKDQAVAITIYEDTSRTYPFTCCC